MTNKAHWQAYCIPPIDHGWQYLRTVAETLSDIASMDYEIGIKGDIDAQTINEFLEGWEAAKQAAGEIGWEGDFRGQPRVFWLPSEYDCQFGFVFKQDNNGTTFVVSPQPLPHLGRVHQT